jgi:hypothetical protein
MSAMMADNASIESPPIPDTGADNWMIQRELVQPNLTARRRHRVGADGGFMQD